MNGISWTAVRALLFNIIFSTAIIQGFTAHSVAASLLSATANGSAVTFTIKEPGTYIVGYVLYDQSSSVVSSLPIQSSSSSWGVPWVTAAPYQFSVSVMPLDGSQFDVGLWIWQGTQWQQQDVIYTYGAAGAQPCISTEAALQAAMQSGADAVLCPGVTIPLNQAVTFTANNQKIYTEGFFQNNSASNPATLLISNPALTSAIDMQSATSTGAVLDGLEIAGIIVDGNAQVLNKVSSCGNNCHGLVNLHAVTNPIVTGNVIRNSRTWSELTLMRDPCTGAQITNNYIGPAVPAVGANAGMYTDGISVFCQNSLISGNQIVDATDAGIVVFDQPNVSVIGNTITAQYNHMNIALSSTDFANNGTDGTPSGDYNGTVYSNNIINSTNSASGGYIYVGIAAGDHLWFGDLYDNPPPNTPPPSPNAYGTYSNLNATITGNTLNGGDPSNGSGFGVGIAVSGVTGYTIMNNALNNTNMAVDLANVDVGLPSGMAPSTLQAGYASVGRGTLDVLYGREFFVYRLYKNFLGWSAADPAGFLFWTTSIGSLTTQQAIATTQSFVANPNVAAHINSQSATSVVTALYQVILNRAPEDEVEQNGVLSFSPGSGPAFWQSSVSGAPSLAQGAWSAVPDFYASPEYQHDVGPGGGIYNMTN